MKMCVGEYLRYGDARELDCVKFHSTFVLRNARAHATV